MHIPSLIRLVVGFILMGVISVFFLTALVLLIPFRVARIKVANWYGKICGRTVMLCAGITPAVEHQERLDGSMPAIYVCNHTSSVDGFICTWMCPVGGCGVFKKEIVRVPFYGQVAWLSGHLLLDRQNKEKAVAAMAETAAFVRKHKLGIWIMPEGTRSKDGSLLPFKKGFVHMAIATGLPVVPVIIHGANLGWEYGKFRFRPTTLKVEVLEPVQTTEWKEESAAEHAEAVRSLFAERLKAAGLPVAPVPAAA